MNSIIEALWCIVSPLIPTKTSKKGRPEYDNKKSFEGIMFVLEEGIRWKSLSKTVFGKPSTIHGKFIKWSRNGLFNEMFSLIRKHYNSKEGCIDNWLAVDTSSRAAPFYKNAGKNPTDRGKRGVKYVVAVDREGAPLYVDIGSANTHDSQLIDSILKQLSDKKIIKILAADSAFDSQKLYKQATNLNIALVASPNKRRNKNKEGLQPSKYRWVVERSISHFMWNRGLKPAYFKLHVSLLSIFQLAAAIRVFKML